MSTVIASLTSAALPLPGQKARSSWADMSFGELSDEMKFTLQVSGAAGVSFSIVEDKSGSDSVVAENLVDGSVVTLKSGDRYYIATPKNANNQGFSVGFATNT